MLLLVLERNNAVRMRWKAEYRSRLGCRRSSRSASSKAVTDPLGHKS